MIEGLTFADYTILAGILAVVIAFFLAFVKKPKWGKKNYYEKEMYVDKDILFIFAGNEGAGYVSMVDRRHPIKSYSDGTIDVKLVDGTELKHVNLERNLKLIKNTNIFYGPLIIACNINANNRETEWITYDEIKERARLSLKAEEEIKEKAKEEAFDILEIKKKFEEHELPTFRPPT